MSPDRKTVVNGKKVEEYCWAWKMVTYIDNPLFDGSYESAIDSLSKSPPTVEAGKETR